MSEYIAKFLKSEVEVVLYSGATFRGVLASVDAQMNLALDNAREYHNGLPSTNFGQSFIRGATGLSFYHISRPLQRSSLCPVYYVSKHPVTA
jgi:small nuclear ribonucleoprotein (snRNP)-like protein